jgi:hypothetical protein
MRRIKLCGFSEIATSTTRWSMLLATFASSATFPSSAGGAKAALQCLVLAEATLGITYHKAQAAKRRRVSNRLNSQT